MKMTQVLAHANWLNGTGSGYRRLDVSEVVKHINGARVGLILSRVEGQCLASMEYLLCGIPVVSTESKGGRDAFFDEAYVVIAKDNSAAVSKAVDTLKTRNLDPKFIRHSTLKKVTDHRSRFCDLINSFKNKDDCLRPETWFDRWENKLRKFCEPSEFAHTCRSKWKKNRLFWRCSALKKDWDVFLG